MISAGIDPGLSGALAAIFPDGSVKVWDAPCFDIESNGTNRRESDIKAMLSILMEINGDCLVAIEKVHGMPKMGGAAMFTFGRCYGHWEALLTAADMPHEKVTPQAWKKAMLQGSGKDKDASRIKAMQLFPKSADYFKRKCDDGRAEAALIAEYCRRYLCVEQPPCPV